MRKITKKGKKKTEIKQLPVVPEAVKKTKIRVIGIGGGAGNIVSEIASRIEKATFVAANTDPKALRTVRRKVTRFQFGQSLTHGLGTGMNPDLGREAALDEKDKIKKLLEGQDLCIIIACLGGGTGSGAAPIFAKISKSLGNLTYGIFTLPFKFEGDKKVEIAKEGLEKVKGYLNAFSVIPNERVFQIIDKNTPLRQALSVINRSLAESLEGLIETIYEPGLINIDFADLRTILDGRGRLAYLNSVSVPRKEGASKDLINKALNSPLYPYSIKGAKGVLLNIAGEKELSLAEVNQISKTIAEMVNPEAKIIFGISQGKKYSDIIKTSFLITGCGMKLFPQSAKSKRKKIKKIAHQEKLSKEQVKKTEKKPKQHHKKKISHKKIVKKPMVHKRRKPKKPRKPRKSKPNKTKIKKQKTELKTTPVEVPPPSEPETVRKSALQIRREAEEVEKEMLEKEKFWETPAFLRKKLAK
ncbi:MAG: cell division protein FtsZ [Candidatus Nealsonbacteria bacterium RBG_13_42_11]|uniref:Cell division protein FtsZ n=1 Tax=Candidatus Nealsonbacteria bacterium RBG_13_42_11 TaxID=1801663 RepID=A0A1G2DYG2_9BACT|nr:MAG: cell division protein FtsZ [Candidatus Nealsonbacteria bacterium RBG_13_42_11]